MADQSINFAKGAIIDLGFFLSQFGDPASQWIC
jgi:hypothetical protein